MNNSEILELAQHKLVILYIIKGANHLFSDDDLNKFILENDLINFFFLNQYVTELKSTNLIANDSNNRLYITNDGEYALNIFINKIPQDIINLLKDKLNSFKKIKIQEQSVNATYYKDDYDRYFCELSIKEDCNIIMSLNFEVPNEEFAKNICDKFKKEPSEYYLKIINIFNI